MVKITEIGKIDAYYFAKDVLIGALGEIDYSYSVTYYPDGFISCVFRFENPVRCPGDDFDRHNATFHSVKVVTIFPY